jgi:hypothetical protein
MLRGCLTISFSQRKGQEMLKGMQRIPVRKDGATGVQIGRAGEEIRRTV